MIELIVNCEKVTSQVERYNATGGIAIRFMCKDGIPYAMLTVCVPEYKLQEGEFLVKTWSENKLLARIALGSEKFIDTGKRVRVSPFCEAQVWKLAEGEL